MPEEKKEKKPAAPPSKDLFNVVEDFYTDNLGSPVALIMFVIFVVVLGFVTLISNNKEFQDSIVEYLTYHTSPYISTIKTSFTIITIIWIAGIIYLFIRTREVDNIEYHKYKSINVKENEQKEHSTQWQTVLDYLDSDNPAEWRIAVLEADAMLDDVIKKIGGIGDTLGERLKSIDPAGFKSLQAAWDAHKVRNMIAHEGVNYQLTKRETKRVIDLYEQVFKEFQYI